MTQRSDGRWVQSVTIDGKRKYFYSIAKNERSATADINRQIAEYTIQQSEKCPFSKISEEWADYHCNQIPYTTWKKCYRASYDDVVSYFGDISIGDITAPECHKFLQTFIAKRYSQKKISTLKSVVSMIMDYAIIQGKIKYNPIKDIKLPAGLPKKPRTIPSDDVINMIKLNYNGEDFLPYFLMYSGLRISEAIALTYEDIDFDKKTIWVDKKIVHDDNVPVLIPRTKSDAGTRYVILLDRLANKLHQHKKGLLFPNKKGKHLTKRQLSELWERWQKRHNTKVTAHQLRHAYATLLYEAGIDVKTAQGLLGHADIHMTMDIYADIRAKQLESAREKLNNFDL